MTQSPSPDYAELRAALEKATPGPWNERPEPDNCPTRLLGANTNPDGSERPRNGPPLNGGMWVVETRGPDAEANARFIALSREAVPSLLADLDAAQARIAANDHACELIEGGLILLARAIREGDPARELHLRIDDLIRDVRQARLTRKDEDHG